MRAGGEWNSHGDLIVKSSAAPNITASSSSSSSSSGSSSSSSSDSGRSAAPPITVMIGAIRAVIPPSVWCGNQIESSHLLFLFFWFLPIFLRFWPEPVLAKPSCLICMKLKERVRCFLLQVG
jgi:hypothetical protein